MRALRPGATFETDRLLAPDEAIAAYLRALPLAPAGIEAVPLAVAAGRILAADAVADAAHPADDRSTMDGFAVRAGDGMQRRRIVGTIRMGHAPPTGIVPGETLRIPTGGVLPAGADAVIPVEDAREVDDGILPAIAASPGDNLTPRGSDMAPGDLVLAAGRRIGAPELSVLATLGITEVQVYRRPRVAIVSTGDELVDARERPGTGQVRDSNRWAVAGGLAALGCEPLHIARAADAPESIRDAIRSGLAAADAVVLTGGSSVGARDHVPAAVDALGAPGVIVHGIRVKPGKPTVLAAVGNAPVIGLPGNPASALTILDAVVAPLFHRLAGERAPRRSTLAVRAGTAFPGRPGWTWYVPAVLDGDEALPLALRSSHTSLLARADGYVVVGPHAPVERGDRVVLVRYGGFW